MRHRQVLALGVRIVVVSCALVLAVSVLRSRVALVEAYQRTTELQRSLAESALEAAALRELVSRNQVEGSILSGFDVRAQRARDITIGLEGVYYVMAPECAASIASVGYVKQLAEMLAMPLAALTFSGDTAATRALGSESGFLNIESIIALPSGPLASLVPRNGTPVTLVVRRGHIAAIGFGGLDSASVAELAMQAKRYFVASRVEVREAATLPQQF